MGWLSKLFGRSDAVAPTLSDAAPTADAQRDPQSALEAYLGDSGHIDWSIAVRDLPSASVLLALGDTEAIQLLAELLRRDALDKPAEYTSATWVQSTRRQRLIAELSRRTLRMSTAQAGMLVRLLAQSQLTSQSVRHPALPKMIARSGQAGGWLAEIVDDLRELHTSIAPQGTYVHAGVRSAMRDIERIIESTESGGRPHARIRHDAWGELAQLSLEGMDPALRDDWQNALDYAASAKGSAPSAKWLKGGADVIESMSAATFASTACAWLALLGSSLAQASERETRHIVLDEDNGDLLKGIAWLLVHVPEESSADALADATLAAFKKIPNVGARSAKVGNACLHTLKGMPGLMGARRLAVLRTRIKLPSQLGAVNKALSDCAQRLGLSVADTEELATPDHGFLDAHQDVAFGDARAQLQLDGTAVALAWFGADGKPRKGEPAQVKTEFADRRKRLKKLIADTEQTLMSVRDRLERTYLDTREWPVDVWRERYHDHPVAGALARRLIWNFQRDGAKVAALWTDGQWQDDSGNAIDTTGTTVSLWHPIFASLDSVRRWRANIAQRELTQPFKQAHREIYVLTDAEGTTRVYSNRFAAHVLRQHQFASLCTARGWRYRLQGGFDSQNWPTLDLPRWNLSVEFWVDSPHDAARGGLSEAGIYLHVLSDQVRYCRRVEGEDNANARTAPLPLESVPTIVLSETMRDVDLFVGVCSIGNDPTWVDSGPEGHYRAYWHSYSFGDLSVAAQNRADIIAELLPRLALRDKAKIEGRFLVVNGALRTYKIHLGSGNILMEPNDQYLCIVADRRAESHKLRLPFEGDALLSLILSKAFLLARDAEIADPSIKAQIN